MKIISWNINGMKSFLKKINFQEFVNEIDPDIICLQEIKCNKKILELPNYFDYWSFSNKLGYSGVVIFTKQKPITFNIDTKIDANEGCN